MILGLPHPRAYGPLHGGQRLLYIAVRGVALTKFVNLEAGGMVLMVSQFIQGFKFVTVRHTCECVCMCACV